MAKNKLSRKITEIILLKCLGYKKGEKLLIVTDDRLKALGEAFYEQAGKIKTNLSFMKMPTRKTHGAEPPAPIAEGLKKADVAVLLTYMSLSHTKARKTATSKYGTRIASLPGATFSMLERTIAVDYAKIREKVLKTAQALTRGEKAEIRSKAGTYLTMSLKKRKGFCDDGLYFKKGAFGNLPAGEACTGPFEGTTNGRLVVDGSAPYIGKVKKPITINIKDGYAVNIPIPAIAALRKKFGRCILNVAELGIGYNPKATITGNILEDEKAENTAHIAFGNNISFGGKVSCPSHLDLVFLKPEILIDGKSI